MITVIVPYKDAAKYVEETLDSILTQTFEDFEILCIDNGSTDNSRDIVDKVLKRAPVKSRNLSFPTQGKCLALNFAIQNCSSEWLAICDADDLWDPDKLKEQFKLASSGISIIGTQMSYIDNNGAFIPGAPTLPVDNNDIVYSVLHKRENAICNSSVMYRRSIHTHVVGFYDPLCSVEDYDMWSRCAFAGLRFENHKASLVYHRIHEGSNFNSSPRQALHKNLIDGRNEAWHKIETICRSEK